MSESTRTIWSIILLSLSWILVLGLIVLLYLWIEPKIKKRIKSLNEFVDDKENHKIFGNILGILFLIWIGYWIINWIAQNRNSIIVRILGALLVIRYIIKWPLIILWSLAVLYYLIRFIKRARNNEF